MKQWFLNLPTRGKLAMVLGTGVLLLAIVVGTGFLKTLRFLDSQRRIQQVELENLIDYATLDRNVNANLLALVEMMQSSDSAIIRTLRGEIAETSRQNDLLMERVLDRAARDPIPPDRVEALDAARKEFNRVRDELIIPAILQARTAERQAALTRGSELSRIVRSLCTELSDLARGFAKLAMDRSVARIQASLVLMAAIGMLSAAASLVMIPVLNRIIAAPLATLTEAARRIAVGDMDVQVLTAVRRWSASPMET